MEEVLLTRALKDLTSSKGKKKARRPGHVTQGCDVSTVLATADSNTAVDNLFEGLVQESGRTGGLTVGDGVKGGCGGGSNSYDNDDCNRLKSQHLPEQDNEETRPGIVLVVRLGYISPVIVRARPYLARLSVNKLVLELLHRQHEAGSKPNAKEAKSGSSSCHLTLRASLQPGSQPTPPRFTPSQKLLAFRAVVSAADVVCTTTIAVGAKNLSPFRFRRVLVDEAGQGGYTHAHTHTHAHMQHFSRTRLHPFHPRSREPYLLFVNFICSPFHSHSPLFFPFSVLFQLLNRALSLLSPGDARGSCSSATTNSYNPP